VTPPRKLLVTGAAGFIGSTLVDRLLREGREVVGLDSFDPFYPEEQKRRNLAAALDHPRFRLERGDIRDAEAMGRIFSEGTFEGVVHLAALAGVRPSLERPEAYADVNVHGTSVVLAAAARCGRPRVVFASSSSVYGERDDGPFRETDAVERPVSPAEGLSITCTRIFTAYGPRQRPDLAIRKFAERMLRGEPVPIYGNGSNLRDFTYVDDLVEGLVRAVDRDLGFAILNFGAGRKISVLEVVKLLEQNLGTSARIEWLPPQTGDVPRTWADIGAAREALGYEPGVPFVEGIRRFVRWLEEPES
jgi:UDP-glucuronate 4-epimerase